MKEGDIVLASLPQADAQFKIRPALFLRRMPPFGDLLVCGISSQLHQCVSGFDELIGFEDVDFSQTGLKAKSLFRLGYLAVLPESHFNGAIGSISPERHHRLLERLAAHIAPHALHAPLTEYKIS